jgi:hypothetical protein
MADGFSTFGMIFQHLLSFSNFLEADKGKSSNFEFGFYPTSAATVTADGSNL